MHCRLELLTPERAWCPSMQAPPAKETAALFWAAAVLDVASAAALEGLRVMCRQLERAELDEGTWAWLFQAHMALERVAVAQKAAAAGSGEAGSSGGTKGEADEDAPLRLLPECVLVRGEAAWRCQLADASERPVSISARLPSADHGHFCMHQLTTVLLLGCGHAGEGWLPWGAPAGTSWG